MFDFLSPKISAFGIDLSDWSIKIANLEKKEGQIFLVSFGRQEIKEGLIEEGEIKNEEKLLKTIEAAIKNIKGEKIKTQYCIVSLPETVSFVQILSLPLMEEKEVAEAIKWELEAHIPLSLEEIYFDWKIISCPETPDPKSLKVLVGALPKKTVDPYLSVLSKAGLKPAVFEIESVATVRALIRNNPPSESVIILDLGAKRTSLAIASSRAVYFTTSLPISNYSLVKTLSQELEITFEKAYHLKITKGLEDFDKQSKIFQTLKPALLDLTHKIKEYIDFYHEHCVSESESKNQISRIILCGGGANLSGLSQFLADELALEVIVGQPLEGIEVPKDSLGFKESLAYTTALGLALENFN